MGPNKIIKKIKKARMKFNELEPRGYIYRLSRELIENKWRNNIEITEAICLLLQIWNSALYRYAFFDIEELNSWIDKNKRRIDEIKRKRITIERVDEKEYAHLVKKYFEELIEVTKVKIGKKDQIKRSPVGVAKILHLLCPEFFPLWDNAIANKMKVMWDSQKKNYSEKYLECCLKTLNFKRKIENNPEIKNLIKKESVSILKIIDEFNYICFTKKEIKLNKEEINSIYPKLYKNELS